MSYSRHATFGYAGLLTVVLAMSSIGCSARPMEPTASDCPSLVPGTSDALVDYFDMVIWQDRSYVADQILPGKDLTKAVLGRRIAQVKCNVYDWSAKNGGLSATTWTLWPDGTATALMAGTPVREVQGVKAECALGARNTQGDLHVYVAVDLDGYGMPALCR